jgi:hypothetical protein
MNPNRKRAALVIAGAAVVTETEVDDQSGSGA